MAFLFENLRERAQALGAGVASIAKAHRSAKAGLLLMDAASGANEADQATGIAQLATGASGTRARASVNKHMRMRAHAHTRMRACAHTRARARAHT